MTSGSQAGTQDEHNSGRPAVRISRVVLGALLPAASVGGLLLPPILFRDELPDPVASHFDLSGAPDDSMSLLTFVLFAGFVLVLPGALMMVAAATASRRMPRPAPPFLAGTGAFLAGLGAGIMIQMVVAQRGISDWTEAEGPAVGVAFTIGGAVIAGIIAAWLGRTLPYDAESSRFAAPPGSEVPGLQLAEGERAVFTETITPVWTLWIVAAILPIAGVFLVLGSWPTVIIMAVSAVPLILFSSLQVQADLEGLSVRSALVGFRFASVKSEEIEQASVIDVQPMKWGGWGYRGSLKLAGTAAVVIRKGPGIHLKLSGDRVFVVTLDNPHGAAAVLNARVG